MFRVLTQKSKIFDRHIYVPIQIERERNNLLTIGI